MGGKKLRDSFKRVFGTHYETGALIQEFLLSAPSRTKLGGYEAFLMLLFGANCEY